MSKLSLNDWLILNRKPISIKKTLATLNFDYSQLTLEEIDTYKYSMFECDGDSKTIKVTIGDVKR